MPTKLRKPPVVEEVEDDEEELDDEDEEVVVKPVKRTSKTVSATKPVATKASANGKATTSAKAPTTATAGNSARYYVTQVLVAGAPQDEVKKRAIAAAKKDGSAASFKTFNVPYFINFLVEKKGYRKTEKNGTVKLIAPRA